MEIQKKKLNDIVELARKKWKVVDVYTTQNTNFYYKDRMIMINIETGQKINCANSLT